MNKEHNVRMNILVKKLLKEGELRFVPSEYYHKIVEIMNEKVKNRKIKSLQYGTWGDSGRTIIINSPSIVIYVKENTFPLAA